MNASGRPNTCKSNGIGSFGGLESGARVRNAYATNPRRADSRWKRRISRHAADEGHPLLVKAETRWGTGMRPIR